MVDTKQALITVGGSGSRLQQAGVPFVLSKSFYELEGHPLFYWSLMGLRLGGIERLVVISDMKEKLDVAENILADFPLPFSEIKFHKDPGLGSNGLPYQARHLLEDQFFFECGHSMSEPSHYARMEGQKQNGTIVMSAFPANDYAPRPVVRINNGSILPISKLTGNPNEFAVGSPRLLDQDYVKQLPSLDFDLKDIIPFYSKAGKLQLVRANLPIEVDVVQELEEALPVYIEHIRRLPVP